MCIKRVFSTKQRVLKHLTTFLLNKACKCKDMLVLALDTLIWLIECVCTFPNAFIAFKPIMCKKRVFSAKYRVLAHLTSFLLKNAIKRKETLVLALVSIILHSSMRLYVSQCIHCIKTDTVQKKRFKGEIPRFSAFKVVFAEKRI